MSTYLDLNSEIKELAGRTGRQSITPNEVFGVMSKILSKTQGVDMTSASMSIRISYSSYEDMISDLDPVDPENSKQLKYGQLALVKENPDGGDGIYRYISPGWEFVRRVADMEEITDFWPDNVTITGYISKTGSLLGTSDPNWQSSDFIAFPAAKVISIRCFGHPVVNAVAFYDEDYNFISGEGGTVEGLYEVYLTSPPGTKYIKLSGGSQTYANAQSSKPFRAIYKVPVLDKVSYLQENIKMSEIKIVNRKPLKINFTAAYKIILAGDSRVSTDYSFAKNAFESITGAQVYNGGFSGYTAAQLASNVAFARIFDYNPNLIILMLEGNDTGAAGTVGSFAGLNEEPIVGETDIQSPYSGTYFIQAISYIARKIKANYYNIRARANLTGSETEAEKTAKIDAVLKPYLVFCTGLPQNRNSSSDAYSLAKNWRRKRDAICEVCQKYNIHCVDTFSLVEWDMSLEPYWTSPTNTTNNRGIYTMDGLHPNKWGWENLASLICGEFY